MSEGPTSRSAYRAGMGALCDDFNRRARHHLERGAHLSVAARRRLPRRLRVELAGHEEALNHEVTSLEEIESRQRRLASYEAALDVADTWLNRRAQLLGGNRPAAVIALMVAACLAPVGAMLALRYAAIAVRCANDDPALPGHPNVAAVVSPRAPQCIAVETRDCATACATEGRCVPFRGRCAADRREACRASRGCREAGACTLSGERCVVRSSSDCQGSEGCLWEGRCTVSRSEQGARRCIALDDGDCAGSLACQTEDRCEAREGACELPIAPQALRPSAW
ncbi:MAG: hypothetical protein KC731_23560 [Myxococcales bacterium]|nr:hypothetical protein [Myxococcales bacterium]